MGQQDVSEVTYVPRTRHSSETRPDYLVVLYDVCSWDITAEGPASPLADVQTDAQLFDRIRREIAKTQYSCRSYGESIR